MPDHFDDTEVFRLGDDEFIWTSIRGKGTCLLVTRANGDVYEIGTFKEWDVGRELDRWLERTYSDDPLQGFEGFITEIWNHETRSIDEGAFLTPGTVAPCFDLASFVAWQEGCGNRVLTVRKASGEVLYDRKDEIRGQLTEIIRPW